MTLKRRIRNIQNIECEILFISSIYIWREISLIKTMKILKRKNRIQYGPNKINTKTTILKNKKIE